MAKALRPVYTAPTEEAADAARSLYPQRQRRCGRQLCHPDLAPRPWQVLQVAVLPNTHQRLLRDQARNREPGNGWAAHPSIGRHHRYAAGLFALAALSLALGHRHDSRSVR